jgi:hypothetical protein
LIQTETISEKQQRIAGMLMHGFRVNHNSAAKKIKASLIISRLRERGCNIGDAELRDIIGHIRRNDLCSPGFILSDNGGYWYSEDRNEMELVWKSQYGRAIEIMKNFQPLHKRFKHLVSEENSIFKI